MVERRRKRHQAVTRYAPISAHHPDHARERRGLTDRAAGVRAQRGRRQVRGDGRRRAAARAARDPREVSRVVSGKETGVFRRRTHSKFVAIRLAEDRSSGGLQPLDGGGVVWGNVTLEDARGAGGSHALRRKDVLDGHRHARKRRQGFLGANLAVNLQRLGERALRRERQVCSDGFVFALDSGERRAHQLLCGKLAGEESRVNRVDCERGQIHGASARADCRTRAMETLPSRAAQEAYSLSMTRGTLKQPAPGSGALARDSCWESVCRGSSGRRVGVPAAG